jgi:hypothetical protein
VALERHRHAFAEIVGEGWVAVRIHEAFAVALEFPGGSNGPYINDYVEPHCSATIEG